MLGELSGWVPQAGATGLLLMSVWLVLTGRIVPRSTHDEVRVDRDAYRDAAQAAIKANTEAAGHVGRLTSAVEQLTAAQRETLALLQKVVPPVVERP